MKDLGGDFGSIPGMILSLIFGARNYIKILLSLITIELKDFGSHFVSIFGLICEPWFNDINLLKLKRILVNATWMYRAEFN